MAGFFLPVMNMRDWEVRNEIEDVHTFWGSGRFLKDAEKNDPKYVLDTIRWVNPRMYRVLV
jgi:hypothetical protein